MINQLIDAVANMREKEAFRIVDDMLDTGADPLGVLDACRGALEIIGKRFEVGEVFLPELIMAGQMMGKISAAVKPRIKRQVRPNCLGKVLIGTVVGDIHDIGKNIVIFLLDAHGFDVIDLGVNVSPRTFVKKIQEIQPEVVGLSALLTLAFDSMKRTVDAIKESGLRDRVKIMIGGAPVNEQVRAHTGADAWGRDAVAAVSLVKQWVGGGR
jgi:methylmalonyl-CoA mutase cobalamin-binding domain/chain